MFERIRHGLYPFYPSRPIGESPERSNVAVRVSENVKAASNTPLAKWNCWGMQKRILCEKSCILRHEADNAECNECHVDDSERRMRDSLAESLFTLLFADAFSLGVFYG